MAKQNRSRFARSDQPGPGSKQGSFAESGKRNDDGSGSSESSAHDPNLAYLSGNRRTSSAHKLNARCCIDTATRRDQQSAVSSARAVRENLPPQRTRSITKASLSAFLRGTSCLCGFQESESESMHRSWCTGLLKCLQAAAYRELSLCKLTKIKRVESRTYSQKLNRFIALVRVGRSCPN